MRDDLATPNFGKAKSEYDQRFFHDAFRTLEVFLSRMLSPGPIRISGVTTSTATWSNGAGTPEGVVIAPVGSLFTRTDGGAGTTLYVKESGAGNTGWVGK